MSLVAMSVMCFTFQSGSIQIVRLYPLNLERIPLHSNLVLFKLHHGFKETTTYRSLHSNLVLFK